MDRGCAAVVVVDMCAFEREAAAVVAGVRGLVEVVDGLMDGRVGATGGGVGVGRPRVELCNVDSSSHPAC